MKNDVVFPFLYKVKKGDAKKSSTHFSRLTLSCSVRSRTFLLLQLVYDLKCYVNRAKKFGLVFQCHQIKSKFRLLQIFRKMSKMSVTVVHYLQLLPNFQISSLTPSQTTIFHAKTNFSTSQPSDAEQLN